MRGDGVWAPLGERQAQQSLLPPVVCPKCRGTAARVCASLVCDCGWRAPRLGQRGGFAPPVEPPPTLAARYRNEAARREQALAFLRDHPWSSAGEVAAAIGCGRDCVRLIFAAAVGVARRTRGSSRTYEYALTEEAVAC